MTTRTCTVTIGADGTRCGKSSVYDFVSTMGDTLSECVDHFDGVAVTGPIAEHRVGDHVTVHRYGKTYDAVVSYVGKRGAVHATFTYDNGTQRTVRV